jgi:integrase
MSVYPRGKKGIYDYDFQQGHRFLGSTGCTTKREASAFEAEVRKKAQLELAAQKAKGNAPMTFDSALGKFWDEAGVHYKGTYGKTVFAALDWLLNKSGIGAATALPDIGPALINAAIARRRGEGVSDATVNRTVTELLRAILNRARRNWEQDVREIEWKKYLLKEMKERVKSLKTHEEPLLMASLAERDDYLPAISFKLKSGFRKCEVVNLKKSDIDWGNRTISVIGKGGKPDTIPLSTELREILWPLQNHPTEYVFTYVAQATRTVQGTEGRSVIRGERYPITYSGLATAWRRFGPRKAGIEDFRLHDLRHTAATRLLKGGKANLKVVQRLMRHEDITTTAKYAHAYDEDVLEAMEAETQSRREVPQIVPQVIEKKA